MTLPDKWITDWEPSARMPDYTRANAGEVLAGPVSPLGWTLVWEQGCGPGWAQGFVEYGVYRPGELPEHQPPIMGLFGGYFYIGLTHMRLWGIRSGVGWQVIDQAQLGSHPETPPYEPHPDDECPECEERIAETSRWIMSATDFPEATDDRVEADATRASRPDLASLSDAELVERARAMLPLMDKYFCRHIMSSASAPVGAAVIEGLLAEIGRADIILELISGLGDVDSAAPSEALWDLSRRVNASPQLTQLFDEGVPAVAEALPSDPDGFGQAFEDFLYAYGSRGPNEFDIREHSWETKPELALALVDTIRRSPDDQAPELRRERLRESRERLAREVRDELPDEKRQLFDDALRSASVFIPARERTKTNIIKVIHEVRMPVFMLGRRSVEAGLFADVTDVTMLLASELDDYVEHPDSFRDTIAERLEGYRELWDIEPPFIIAGEVKPLSQWKRRAKEKAATAAAGDVLSGVPGCAGSQSGVARVVETPDAAAELEPGDILIAPATDPAWTPLFLIAGGVVVNVGSRNSHAVIISRELGIPCVVSVTGATEQIADGSTVTVDGAMGTVTIDAVPARAEQEPAGV